MSDLAGEDERPFIDALPPFAELVTGLCTTDPEEDPGAGTEIDDMKVSLPVELEIEVDETGVVHVAGAPPLLRTRTDFMPVYHGLRLRIKEGTGGG